jgi:hypothetical protein
LNTTGNPLFGLVVIDTLPQTLEFVPGSLVVSGGTTLSVNPIEVYISSLLPGVPNTIRFDALILPLEHGDTPNQAFLYVGPYVISSDDPSTLSPDDPTVIVIYWPEPSETVTPTPTPTPTAHVPKQSFLPLVGR